MNHIHPFLVEHDIAVIIVVHSRSARPTRPQRATREKHFSTKMRLKISLNHVGKFGPHVQLVKKLSDWPRSM